MCLKEIVVGEGLILRGGAATVMPVVPALMARFAAASRSSLAAAATPTSMSMPKLQPETTRRCSGFSR